MRDTKVLLLGWDLMPAGKEEVGQANGCFAMAKALGGRVDLSMILPAADPDFVLQNVTLTGLNNLDLPAIEPAESQKDIQPFAQGPHIRQQIPLYGAPDQPVNLPASSQAQQVGQAASAGMLQQEGGQKERKGAIEHLNIFDPDHLSQVSLDAQIIQYARWATRVAAHHQFQVIYAYDWRTFLAGSELKLISEKPLVLQVHSLKEEHNSQGWMQQLEMQALQKADCIIAATDELAATMKEKYSISPEVIYSLERKKSRPSAESGPACEENAKGLHKNGLGKDRQPGTMQGLAKKADQEENRERAADRIREILMQVVA
jgi:glycogen synthase